MPMFHWLWHSLRSEIIHYVFEYAVRVEIIPNENLMGSHHFMTFLDECLDHLEADFGLRYFQRIGLRCSARIERATSVIK